MPRRCAAANCSNTPGPTISVFRFPKDPKLRHEWTLQVQRTRDNWKGPTDASGVCSDHFLPECFDTVPALKTSLGCDPYRKRDLLPTAVPTIFKGKETDPGTNSPTKRRSNTVQKLEKRRVVAEILKTACVFETRDTYTNCNTEIATQECSPELQPMQDSSCQTESNPTQKRTVGVFFRYKGKNKGTQTPPPAKLYRTIETQTTLDMSFELSNSKESHHEQNQDEDISEDEAPVEEVLGEKVNKKQQLSDSDYTPSSGEDSDSTIPDQDEPQSFNIEEPESLHKTKKYIIFFSALLKLLSWCCCPECGHKELRSSESEFGSMLIITLMCKGCGRETVWHSQPYVGDTPAGNILLSASILFAGATIKKVLRVFKHMGVVAISSRTFFRHQQSILQKAILDVWRSQQNWLLATCRGLQENLICGGDGRADSPGHSAKYGTYTLLELQQNVILDVQLVQSNECGGSYHMEKEGLVRGLQLLRQHNLDVDVLVTDRHRQIAKFIREDHPEIEHLFDIWHVAKALKTKLRAAARKGGCQDITPWISSIVNHLYWCASSTPSGEGGMIEAKWVSVVDHVQNKHKGFRGLFPECSHGELEGREARKKWISPSSKAAVELEKIITNNILCKDIRKLSGRYQTSTLEAFHSLLIQFAPKMFIFSYEGMLCRTILAGMHFNENAHRPQKKTEEGKPKYTIHYPKFKKGGYVVRKVLEAHTFNYVDDLMEYVMEILSSEKTGDKTQPLLDVPPCLNAEFIKPTKEDAVLAHITRFATD